MCAETHFHHTESQVKAVVGDFLGAVNQDSNTQFFRELSRFLNQH